MKKIFFSLLILFAVALTSSASELLNIPYKNIKEEDKIKLKDIQPRNKIYIDMKKEHARELRKTGNIQYNKMNEKL